MAESLDILNTAVSLLIRAAQLAARFSGRVRQRYLKRLANQHIDAHAKEILFLEDRVYKLEMQVSILQKHLHKKGTKPRYSVRERLLILWHLEAFQIPRRKVSRYFGIARSTLYRWLHEIEDQKASGDPANKTPNQDHRQSRWITGLLLGFIMVLLYARLSTVTQSGLDINTSGLRHDQHKCHRTGATRQSPGKGTDQEPSRRCWTSGEDRGS